MDCAKLTIPSLVPDPAGNRNRRYPTPYQSVGPRVVNHLSAKLALALFPPNAPFFRYVVDDLELEAALQADGPTKGAVDESLSRMERSIMATFEGTAMRVPMHAALKHLVVAGNVLIYVDPQTCKTRIFPISNYVVARGADGEAIEIIVEERMSSDTAPQEVMDAAKADGRPPEDSGDADPERPASRDDIVLFTRVKRHGSVWRTEQEVNGNEVASARGRYSLEKCPWLPLRMTPVECEDYGRSLVDEYYGDLASLETLTKSLVQFAAATSKILFMVKPNAMTKAKKLAEAASGDFVQGQKEDVEVLQIEKYNDFQVTKAVADDITRRLSYAFLDTGSIQRKGERVTAQEIREMASELDSGFGGIYATLSVELQLPIVGLIVAYKERKKVLPKLPEGMVRPAVVTGLEALGRGNDAQNLMAAVNAIAPLPGVLDTLINDEIGRRIFAAFNVDPKGLVKSPEQLAQEQQQAAMAQAAATGAPEVVKAVSKRAGEHMADQAAAAQQQPQPEQPPQ